MAPSPGACRSATPHVHTQIVRTGGVVLACPLLKLMWDGLLGPKYQVEQHWTQQGTRLLVENMSSHKKKIKKLDLRLKSALWSPHPAMPQLNQAKACIFGRPSRGA